MRNIADELNYYTITNAISIRDLAHRFHTTQAIVEDWLQNKSLERIPDSLLFLLDRQKKILSKWKNKYQYIDILGWYVSLNKYKIEDINRDNLRLYSSISNLINFISKENLYTYKNKNLTKNIISLHKSIDNYPQMQSYIKDIIYMYNIELVTHKTINNKIDLAINHDHLSSELFITSIINKLIHNYLYLNIDCMRSIMISVYISKLLSINNKLQDKYSIKHKDSSSLMGSTKPVSYFILFLSIISLLVLFYLIYYFVGLS